MKKQVLICLFLIAFLLNACSVQEKMNADIFFERISDSGFEIIDIIYENNKNLYYVKDSESTDYILEFSYNDYGDVNKISFACNKTDKAENFIKYMRDIISAYSPDENKDDIINELTENGKLKHYYTYYDTQWYFWSSFSDINGLYFSVTNKKLSEQRIADYSLKQNDRIKF